MLDGVLIENNDYRRVKVLHLISDQDRARILAWIDEFVNEIPRKAKKIGERLSYLEHKRQDILIKLRNVPDDLVLRPLIEELNILNQQLEESQATKMYQELEKRTLENSREEAQRQLKKGFENYRLSQRAEERLALVFKAQTVLQELSLEMTKRKIEGLERLVLLSP